MLTKIHHIGVAVRNADAALGLYRDALGLPVTKEAVLREQGVRGVLLSAGETEIELLQPLQPNSPVGRFIDARGEGLHHLCFATDDIATELAAAKAKSLPLIDEQPRLGLAGTIAFLHPKATRGVLVEYAQPPAPHLPAGHASTSEPEFDHVAIVFTDLEAGVHTLAANFDLTGSDPHESPSLGITAVRLPIGGGYIGAVTPLSESTPVATFLERRGEGLYLISLGVQDLDQSSGRLRSAGHPVTEPVPLDSGVQLAFVSPRTTNGVLIQLVQRAAR